MSNLKEKKTAIEYVRLCVNRMEEESIFSIDMLMIPDYTRSALQRAFRQLLIQKTILRAHKGIYYKPKMSTVLKINRPLPPSIHKLIAFVCDRNNEIIQIHGAHACDYLHLSLQVPMIYAYYTNGYTRTLKFISGTVKFEHVSDSRILQYNQTKIGLAIAAMYFLSEDQVDKEIIMKIQDRLTAQEYKQLQDADLPIWMKKLLND